MTATANMAATTASAEVAGGTVRLEPSGRSIGPEALVTLLADLPGLLGTAEITGTRLCPGPR